MKKQTIGYWATTGIVALMFLAGGVMDASGSPEVVEGLAHLGYPAYFGVMLGIWKVLGAIVIVAPGLPLIKEWAYAGIAFDVIAASVSHAVSGDGAAKTIVPLVILGFTAVSWWLRPASRRLVPVSASFESAASRAPSATAHA